MYAIQCHARFPNNGLIASTPKIVAACFSTTPASQRNLKVGNPWDLRNKLKTAEGAQMEKKLQRLQDTESKEKRTPKMYHPTSVNDSPKPRPAPKMKGGKPGGRDAKVQPSEKSGGIPNPTKQYLTTASEPLIRLQQPQNLLLVIDLNGTLLYRPDRRQPTKFTPRPNAELFLTYCIETFHVVIWSSAREENVGPMVTTLLTPKLREKVIQIWGRRKFDLTPSDFDRRVICYKRLDTVWKDPKVALSHPESAWGGVWDQSNTILIDDTAEKARSEPYNIIEVPEWSGDMSDNTLPLVHDFLNNLSLHKNVSAALRTDSFTSHLQQMRLRASAAEIRRLAALPPLDIS